MQVLELTWCQLQVAIWIYVYMNYQYCVVNGNLFIPYLGAEYT